MPIVTIGRVNLKRRPRKLYAKDGSAALIGRFDGRHTSRAGLDFPWTGPFSSSPFILFCSSCLFSQTNILHLSFEKTSYNNFHRSLSKPNLPRRGLSINDIINVKGRIVERIAQAKVFVSEEIKRRKGRRKSEKLFTISFGNLEEERENININP